MKELNTLKVAEVRNFEIIRDYVWCLAMRIFANRVYNKAVYALSNTFTCLSVYTEVLKKCIFLLCYVCSQLTFRSIAVELSNF